jgi:hypothetical protein
MAVRLHKVESLSTHKRCDLVFRLAKGDAPIVEVGLLDPRQNRVEFTVADRRVAWRSWSFCMPSQTLERGQRLMSSGFRNSSIRIPPR